jgi:hypothetical protein
MIQFQIKVSKQRKTPDAKESKKIISKFLFLNLKPSVKIADRKIITQI